MDIKLYKPVDGSKEFTGTLIAFDAESVTIKIDEEEKTFIRKETATVKLHIEF